CCENRHSGVSADCKARPICRGSEPKIARTENGTSSQEHIASSKIEAARSDVLALPRRVEHCDSCALDFRILLDDHRVGAVGDGRRGEDAPGLPRLDPTAKGMSCRGHADVQKTSRR